MKISLFGFFIFTCLFSIISASLFNQSIYGSFESRRLGDNSFKLTTPGLCKGLWRPDKLLGRCFGLRQPDKVVNELASKIKSSQSSENNLLEDLESFDIHKHIKTSEDCRALCCNLDDACISYQYVPSINQCKIGGVVRLGFEATGTPDWCDPHPPSPWIGKRIDSREGSQCLWKEKQETNQCFGLGDERKVDEPFLEGENSNPNRKLKEKKNQSRMTSWQQCEAACCSDPSCSLYQFLPDRGCYFGSSTQCPHVAGDFTGQRKCVRGYCGGMEDTILPAYERAQKKMKLKKSQTD